MNGRSLKAAVLGLTMLIGTAVPALAYDRDDYCYRNVRKAEWRLNRAVNRHGWASREAQHRRRELARMRAHCRYDGYRR